MKLVGTVGKSVGKSVDKIKNESSSITPPQQQDHGFFHTCRSATRELALRPGRAGRLAPRSAMGQR
jgi:hypothetical protein